jgi:hypothetical protein
VRTMSKRRKRFTLLPRWLSMLLPRREVTELDDEITARPTYPSPMRRLY